MTRFIDVDCLSRHVGAVGADRFMEKLVAFIEQDFLRWKDFDKSARLAALSDIGVIELMPVADAQQYSFKYVNGHPANTEKGMLTVMAFGVLADVDTGYPVLLSELTLTTALRTAATSVMVAKKLARKNSRTMALIGNGSQSEFQALAFHKLLGISEIRCFDVDPLASEKLKRNLRKVEGLTITICDSAKEAVKNVDIITTVTADKRLATILTPDMVAPGVHINAVGGDCPGKTELHMDVLTQGRIFVEFEPQSRIEGDIQQLPAEHQVTEFWEVLSGTKPGRTSDEEITIFDSVGFALEDYSALRLLLDISQQNNLGELIDLVPKPDNSKDLYALLYQDENVELMQAV